MTTIENDWLHRSITYKQCPKCNVGQLTVRVSRPLLGKLLHGSMKLYKCNTCKARVYLKTNII